MFELYKNAAATVPSASTDRVRLFVDTDGLPKIKDDTGTVTSLKGDQGDPGEGVAAGGTAGQVLAKASATDYDTEWVDQAGALITSVNGQTGTVVLDAADVGAEPADATILKDADIGVTVQGYSAVLAGTTASFTTADETKLDGIEAGAEVNVNADWNAVSGDAQILNKPTLGTAAAAATTDFATTAQGALADSALQAADIGVTVQGYSAVLAGTTASFTTADETKLDGIAAGAEVNVNADWNATSGDAEILNKPTLGTAAATASTDYATAAQGALADSAVQPAAIANMLETSDIGVTVQGYSAVLAGTTASFTTADETKLDGIEAGADVTDAANVEPLVDAHLNTATATTDQVLSWNGTDYDWVDQSGGGASYQLYAENPVSPTAPSATGSNAVAIGSGATSTATSSVSFGLSATASGSESLSLGRGSEATQPNSTAVGWSAAATGMWATAIGYNPDATSSGASAIGFNTDARSAYSTAVGANSSGQGAYAITGQGAMALGGSYASGTDSFAAAIANNTSSYGATGANSVAIGNTARASDTGAIALGVGSASSGVYSVCIGGSNTWPSVANRRSSVALGEAANSVIEGKFAFSGTASFGRGGAQTGTLNLITTTTNDTATVLRSNTSAAGTTNQVILPNNSAYAFSGIIVARQQAAGGTASAAWKVEGLIRREGSAGTTVLVNSSMTVIDNTPGWTLALSADTTNGGLAVTATGAAATNIRWVATIQTSECTYA